MKKLVFVIIASILFASCNNNRNRSTESETQNSGTQAKSQSDSLNVATANNSDIDEIVKNYLDLKNALVNDNSKDAAIAGKALETAFKKQNQTSLTEEEKKIFSEIEEDAREHAQHIGENGDNIKHQREHFEILSQDIYDLVKTFGGGQVLYRDFCPMYNNGKGAYWLSETKEIKNPYYGKEMPTCGSVKEELQ